MLGQCFLGQAPHGEMLTSSDSLLMNGADLAWILCPTTVLPVKETRGTCGCVTMASPARGPVPNTTLTTPGGRPVININIQQ